MGLDKALLGVVKPYTGAWQRLMGLSEALRGLISFTGLGKASQGKARQNKQKHDKQMLRHYIYIIIIVPKVTKAISVIIIIIILIIVIIITRTY